MRARKRTWYSSGLSLPSRALAASALVSDEMAARPFAPASLMMGVMRPVGVATAMQMSAFLYLRSAGEGGRVSRQVRAAKNGTERGGEGGTHCRMNSPIQAELASGTSVSASETALTIKSLTESLTAPALPAPLKSSRSFMSLSAGGGGGAGGGGEGGVSGRGKGARSNRPEGDGPMLTSTVTK